MAALKPWECEYVVAPVFDHEGRVGRVSRPFRLPFPPFDAND